MLLLTDMRTSGAKLGKKPLPKNGVCPRIVEAFAALRLKMRGPSKGWRNTLYLTKSIN